ncbi:MAG: aminopeptidase P family protein [Acidobacteriota bacterium]|nr:M24 family metallopeptidase [Acidobacteriota bacterium]MDE3030502.1 aminopeptidase P family protein [Acidobacteriota bacterium]MDE3093103.1 aminopeptidase P family protein [Acidobacteriota bacterium]MDE3139631.1 aminopeptidase P family protein [Acidobacteriota bacterium]MDE3146771.1 aminopeptidase P family protein [Acidobacteriota bacterium]
MAGARAWSRRDDVSVVETFTPLQRAILDQEYPHFSEEEMSRRRASVEGLMAGAEVDHLLVHATTGRGGAVGWLSQWPVTNEAHLVVSPGEADTLLVQYFNHVPLASHIACAARVEWGGPSTIASAIEELRRRGARPGRVGVMGPLPLAYARALEREFGAVVDLSGDYLRLRSVKSEEELVWFELGARMGDLAIAALQEQIEVGVTERDLGAIVEGAYLRYGAVNAIHYFAVNAMDDPRYCVARQYPSTREVRRGDIITTEITANFFEYGGQVLRTFVVGEEANALFTTLHEVACAAFDAISRLLVPGTRAFELVAASQVIEDHGFTTLDDLVHGYGGGYLAPILGSSSRSHTEVPDVVLESGMMLVVQPNVVTTDHRAGVQTGECLVVTPTGPRRLHQAPRGLHRVAG